MGNFIEDFKNFVMGGNDDPDEFDDPAQSGESEARQPNMSGYSGRDERLKSNRQFDISATARLQVVLVRPEVFSDTRQIADHLKENKTVVLNLEAASPEVTRRIIDFVGGVAYASGGNIKPVANNTFIIFPYNVNFVGEDLAAELENNGVVF